MSARAYGACYDIGLSLTDIAAKIRTDIKAAIKAGELPGAPARYSVRAENHIAIEIRAQDWPQAWTDCTGILPLTAALAEVSRRAGIPLLTGALYHHGALARVQRQIADDVPLGARPTDDRYHDLPPDDSGTTGAGFLELGCTAPVNNAPPVAVLGTAADLAAAAIDLLTGRRERPDERIIVFRPMGPPFEHPGILDPLPVHQ